MKYLIANWKQNKGLFDISSWLDLYFDNIEGIDISKVKVIICPPFTLINELVVNLSQRDHLFIEIGVQNISKYPSGPHTGEVGFEQLPEQVKWVIIGHSERRIDGEDNESINEKIRLSLENSKIPIVCFSEIDQYNEVSDEFSSQVFFAIEPLSAISTMGVGKPETIDNIKKVYDNVLSENFIYGGSVDDKDITNYINEPYIKGFLVGGASLDPIKFAEITRKIAQ
jgi:triosephosphate isomerase (TIM)